MAINFIMCSTLYFVFEDSSLAALSERSVLKKSEGRAKKTFNRRFMD
jgi:hypothetical protein